MNLDKLEILFENVNLIVVDKPSGYLSVPSRWGERDQRPCLGTLLQKQLGQQIYPVHRLDEETSGIILFAKTKELHKILNSAFENHNLTKIYQAICETTVSGDGANMALPKAGDRLRDQILRGKKRSYISPVGQNAETLILKSMRLDPELVSYELEPLTGRSHQLRFQLSSRGYPILGDALYGSRKTMTEQAPGFYLPPLSLTEQSIALRAIQLDLTKIAERIVRFNIPTHFQAREF